MGDLTTRRKYFFTAAVFIAMWLLAAGQASNGVLQNSIIDAFSLSDAEKGAPSSINSIASMLALITSILLAGRVRKPVILILGALGCALATVMLGSVSGYALFLIGFALTGFFLGAVDSVSSALIADMYSGKAGARIMCALHAVYGLSGFLMPMLYQRILAGAREWRSVFFVISALAAFAALTAALGARGTTLTLGAGTEDGRLSVKTLKRFVNSKRLMRLFGVTLMYGMYLNAMLVWTPRYMRSGLSSPLESAVLPGLYLGITVSRLILSLLRVNRVMVLRFAIFASAASLAAGVLAGNEYVALGGIVLSSFLTAPTIPYIITLACEEAPGDKFLATTAVLLCCFLGQTLFAPVFGGVESALGITTAMLLGAGTLGFAGVLTLFVARERAEGAL